MNEPVIRFPAIHSGTSASGQPGRGLFRDGMSRVGSAVHVVATDGPAGRAGFTATAVIPVSDDPPTLLVCLNAISRSLRAITANGAFSINTLAAGDEAIADLFAGRSGVHGAERFRSGVWSQAANGVPMLDGALVNFACNLVEASRVATHQVLIGEVAQIRLGPARPGIVYKDRGYHVL